MAETEEAENVWWAAPRFLMSAVAILLLIIVGILLFVWVGNDDESDAAPPAQTQAVAPTPSASLVSSDESVCGLDTTDGTTLTSAPEDVEWEFIGGIAAPKSAKHGPGVVDEQTGVRSCYSHTPEGALLAAAGQAASSGDPELYLRTVSALSVDGPGKAITVERAQDSLSDSGTTPPIEIAGFRLLSYTGDKATVEIVASTDSGSELVNFTSSVVMQWTNGDWYTKYKDDGSSGPVDGQVSDLSGYVLWGPTGG
ncbi:hypothetical protein [uncultured Arthrobacter sp.]|uniref:hypothetical protein n=1 Tax=uncultured Arthrobacter sp. TaxID=114050 RepID=UPI002626EBCD|nr:hypothetical protein [uncultured Arthrobacter sp.]